LQVGQELTGYVRMVRPDGKIDLRIDREGYARVAPLADRIIEKLKENKGRLELDDQSSPDAIREAFDASKKAFKQATGALYKERKIAFREGGIDLVDLKSTAKKRSSEGKK
jgi:predicted RNA-binding protein (virulence factor B family)